MGCLNSKEKGPIPVEFQGPNSKNNQDQPTQISNRTNRIDTGPSDIGKKSASSPTGSDPSPSGSTENVDDFDVGLPKNERNNSSFVNLGPLEGSTTDTFSIGSGQTDARVASGKFGFDTDNKYKDKDEDADSDEDDFAAWKKMSMNHKARDSIMADLNMDAFKSGSEKLIAEEKLRQIIEEEKLRKADIARKQNEADELAEQLALDQIQQKEAEVEVIKQQQANDELEQKEALEKAENELWVATQKLASERARSTKRKEKEAEEARQTEEHEAKEKLEREARAQQQAEEEAAMLKAKLEEEEQFRLIEEETAAIEAEERAIMAEERELERLRKEAAEKEIAAETERVRKATLQQEGVEQARILALEKQRLEDEEEEARIKDLEAQEEAEKLERAQSMRQTIWSEENKEDDGTTDDEQLLETETPEETIDAETGVVTVKESVRKTKAGHDLRRLKEVDVVRQAEEDADAEEEEPVNGMSVQAVVRSEQLEEVVAGVVTEEEEEDDDDEEEFDDADGDEKKEKVPKDSVRKTKGGHKMRRLKEVDVVSNTDKPKKEEEIWQPRQNSVGSTNGTTEVEKPAEKLPIEIEEVAVETEEVTELIDGEAVPKGSVHVTKGGHKMRRLKEVDVVRNTDKPKKEQEIWQPRQNSVGSTNEKTEVEKPTEKLPTETETVPNKPIEKIENVKESVKSNEGGGLVSKGGHNIRRVQQVDVVKATPTGTLYRSTEATFITTPTTATTTAIATPTTATTTAATTTTTPTTIAATSRKLPTTPTTTSSSSTPTINHPPSTPTPSHPTDTTNNNNHNAKANNTTTNANNTSPIEIKIKESPPPTLPPTETTVTNAAFTSPTTTTTLTPAISKEVLTPTPTSTTTPTTKTTPTTTKPTMTTTATTPMPKTMTTPTRTAVASITLSLLERRKSIEIAKKKLETRVRAATSITRAKATPAITRATTMLQRLSPIKSATTTPTKTTTTPTSTATLQRPALGTTTLQRPTPDTTSTTTTSTATKDVAVGKTTPTNATTTLTTTTTPCVAPRINIIDTESPQARIAKLNAKVQALTTPQGSPVAKVTLTPTPNATPTLTHNATPTLTPKATSTFSPTKERVNEEASVVAPLASSSTLKPWERDAKSVANKNSDTKAAAHRAKATQLAGNVGTIAETDADVKFLAESVAPPVRKSTMSRVSGFFKRKSTMGGKPTLGGIRGRSRHPSKGSTVAAAATKPHHPTALQTANPVSTTTFKGEAKKVVLAIKATKAMQTKMMTVAEIEAGDNEDEGQWEKLDARAIEAAKWTDMEIKKVIHEVKTRGTTNDQGKSVITFGQLFVETDQIFDALSGILKTSKKYGVVAYEGEQLWQGTNDNTIITLVTDTHTGIKIKRRMARDLKSAPAHSKSAGFSTGFEQGSKCFVCTKTIYQAEYVGASGKGYHKNCFRCATCKKMLGPSDFFVSYDRAFRCAAHHREFEMSGM